MSRELLVRPPRGTPQTGDVQSELHSWATMLNGKALPRLEGRWSILEFGGDRSGVIDSTSAFRAAAAKLNIAGKGVLYLPDGIYRCALADGLTTPLAEFENMESLRIEGNAEIQFDRTFTGSQICDAFVFTACNNISVSSGLRYTCTEEQPVGERTTRGVRLFVFLEGCDGIEIEGGVASDLVGPQFYSRQSSDPESYRSKNILSRIKAVRCGYGIAQQASGDNLEARLVTENCGRSVYAEGVTNSNVSVRSTDFEASDDCLLTSSEGVGITDYKLRYVNTDSTNADSTQHAVGLLIDGQDPVTHRGIHVEATIVTGASTYIGNAFHLGKRNNAGNPDTVDRGHVIDDLTLVLNVKAGTANQGSVGVCDVGTWGSGESITNFELKKGRFDGTNQPSFNLASLKDVAILRGLFFTAADASIVGNTSSRIVVIGGKGDNFTTSTANTAVVDYIGTEIISTSTQSVINKNFLGCKFAGYLLTQFAGSGRVKIPVVATADLAAAAADYDGTILIEDGGSGNRNVIVYAGGQRFRIDGGANV